MKKATDEDKRVWKKMGRELAVLDALIGRILTDTDYGRVMDAKTWDRMGRINHHLNMLRAEAESRMAHFVHDWSTRTFYPDDLKGINEMAERIREEVQRG